ncbi:hypothetical protein [Vibrio cincinnatiensis]|uniref:hypothetical protein n=1 Tax=Vibrio cincinnatiensis TaxID=675 RepID=UPI001EE13CF0|nr:hypothetical protein [Vibrio cincinnatiensis]MCG3724699.1 hypothetical protein [Vibrio cincinnatiensis]
MNVAWKWIKALGVAALLIAVWVLWLKLDASQLKQTALSDKLSQAQADNQSNLTVISELEKEAKQANELLVKRKRQQIQAEEKLNAEMATIKAQLANVECHIPDAVTQRLREPY